MPDDRIKRLMAVFEKPKNQNPQKKTIVPPKTVAPSIKNRISKFENHLTEAQCGIAQSHIKGIEKTMNEVDCFLFVRPTELDSTRLIKNGFATKSMDIHDKSSNWGPMAGCVPCDPIFSKKEKGNQPNANPNYHGHGDAAPVHLSIPEKLRTELEQAGKMKPVSRELKTILNVPHHYYYYEARGPVKNMARKFCLRSKDKNQWEVFWMNNEELIKLVVWGYNGVPVTGDYDLYMVCPHLSWWKLQMHVLNVEDTHGKSAATLFNTWLLKRMNNACNRTDKPVFHHGAESQNYGFTQSLDRKLAMFTPAGTSRMVDREDLAAILADVEWANYLVIWNKRYEEEDPRLSGQAAPVPEASTPEEVSAWEREAAPISEFNKQLKSYLKHRTSEPRALSKHDFGGKFKGYEQVNLKIHTFQRELEKKLVAVTRGGGGSALEDLDRWFEQNIPILETLSKEVGEASFDKGRGEHEFILKPMVKPDEGSNLYNKGNPIK